MRGMQRTRHTAWRIREMRASAVIRVLLMLLAAALAGSLGAQVELETPLDARRRILPGIGPGAKALHRDAAGRYFVLAAPATAVQVFEADGKSAGQIPPAASRGNSIAFAEDFALDLAGKICVADRGGNAVRIFTPDGNAALSLDVSSPISVAFFPEDEVAVVSLKSDRLVQVFSARSGKQLRTFGNPIEVAEHPEVNRQLNLGRLVTDASGHLYYSFTYFRSPPSANTIASAGPSRKFPWPLSNFRAWPMPRGETSWRRISAISRPC